ncbi:1,4-beta-D-glucan cellobiohydrolase cel6a [Verticillium nonalfalfae]|uniref:Glucanase n=1 Tax=Verticillium nonalfalfae TaxID=1051616 RepID=A0A3M9YBX0_9PEZI|nr:1,4-beta-D-glucan cellobiohydrolase cel6a [Verticillium nonalfalfae]RNJ57038.1 1,4-beta-D-glucan cellobiohydrolase cel6a [Verticillium nonalfalfae]
MAGRLFLSAALLSTAAFAAPLEERQACASQWGQCGGQGWSGPTCCPSGTTCQLQNAWYSQCLPGAAPPPAVTTTRPATTAASSTRPATTVVNPPTTTVAPPPGTTVAPPPGTTVAPPPGGATYSGNPFAGVNQWANAYYRSEVSSLAVPSLSGPLATAAAKVADVPTFQWMDTTAKVPLIDGALADIRRANAAGGNYAGIFVVYNLPDRDCAAAASNGELSIANDGINKYKAYIDSIRTVLLKYNDIRTLLVIEPDSLANMVTNMGVAKCSNAAAAYKECTKYAVQKLDLPHVAQYLDAGHAGWLGWPANIGPAATIFTDIYKEAGKPKSLRGLATNVSNYNAWNATSPAPYTSPNPNYDEKHYVDAFAPLLRQNGWDAKFIIDQGRSGKQPTGQQEWGHWCNALGTGFGLRPTSNTGHPDVDAFVWVKPGGEADGTSDTTAVRYDHFCGSASSMKPAPEAGTWFQAYFEQLLRNANPSF